MKNYSRQQFLLLPTAFLLGAALLAIFLVVFFAKEFSKGAERVNEARREFAQVQLQQERALELQGVAADVRRDWGRIEALFVDAEVPVAFVRFLEGLARERNLAIEISSVSTVSRSEFTYLVFSARIGGSFSDTVRFLEQLENAPYLVEIDQFQMKDEGGSVNTTLSASVSAQ